MGRKIDERAQRRMEKRANRPVQQIDWLSVTDRLTHELIKSLSSDGPNCQLLIANCQLANPAAETTLRTSGLKFWLWVRKRPTDRPIDRLTVKRKENSKGRTDICSFSSVRSYANKNVLDFFPEKNVFYCEGKWTLLAAMAPTTICFCNKNRPGQIWMFRWNWIDVMSRF